MFWHKRPPKEYNPKKRLGLVHVYTGEGKGKTTAALGVALKSAGHQLQVLFIQFCKGHKDYGELLAMARLRPYLDIVQFGRAEITDFNNPAAFDIYLAQQGMDYARRAMTAARPDLIVFDEINPALHYGLVPLASVLNFLDNKHQNTEVILTGRFAPPEILNAADIVTVMTAAKHPYDAADFYPRRGIEH